MNKPLLLTLALLNGLQAHGHQSPANELHSATDLQKDRRHQQQHNHEDIVSFFHTQLQHYNDYLANSDQRAAIDAISKDYHLPSLRILPNGKLNVINDVQKFSNNTRAFLDRLRKAGVTHIQWLSLNVHALNKHTALASGTVVRYLENNQAYNEASATMVVHKSENRWSIISMSFHPKQYVIEFTNQGAEHES